MADKNFFDLLKAKVSELNATENHRDNDWLALQNRLQTALPQAPPERRRAIVLPFLLLTALLSSNAVWWQSSRNDQATMAQLVAQVADLQASMLNNDAIIPVTVRVDTLWRTRYLPQFASIANKNTSGRADLNLMPSTPSNNKDSIALVAAQTAQRTLVPTLNISTIPRPDSTRLLFDLTNLQLPALSMLHLEEPVILAPNAVAVNSKKLEKTTEPMGQNILKFFRPKFIQAGASAGWLFAKSSSLMHEGGFSCNLRGEIGLTRHWSITTAVGMGQVHYKSHSQEAILGDIELPTLPSKDHHFAEIEVTGQKIRQFDLGIRYTFAQPGKPRPFLGLGWGGQTLLPFTVDYEIQHEHNGTIEKAVFEVTGRTRMRNILGLSGGFEMPVSKRMSLNMEGFYLRPWKKPDHQAPDLTGIRAGLKWLF
jgi:hypothetical protein